MRAAQPLQSAARMRIHLASLSFLFLLACSSADEPVPVDAAPLTTVPDDPSGTFAVLTALDVSPPPEAEKVIDALDRAAADPARFVLDRMVATLPEGTTKTIATVAVPFVAPYLDTKLVTLAPGFVPGVRAIASGFARVASHVELVERWSIEPNGHAIRAIADARFDVGPAPVIDLASIGVPDMTATFRMSLDETGLIAVPSHAVVLRYGALVRAGLDLAVVPAAAPGAHDVAQALSALLDCTALSVLVADEIGIGSPALYRTACIAAMTAVAAELDEHVRAIDAAPMQLDLAGAATGVDVDHDGDMDTIRNGRWIGTVTATFAGQRQP